MGSRHLYWTDGGYNNGTTVKNTLVGRRCGVNNNRTTVVTTIVGQ
jgi:hypothetical protein